MDLSRAFVQIVKSAAMQEVVAVVVDEAATVAEERVEALLRGAEFAKNV